MKLKNVFCCCCISLFVLSGCAKDSPQTPMAAIQQQLTEMEGYTCLATLTRTSNKGETSYETRQSYRKDGAYRLEILSPETVAGNYTVFDGKTVCQYNPKMQERIVYDVAPSKQRNALFLGNFLENYLQSEGVSIESAALDESRCTVLEAIIPSDDPSMASEKLWIDNETLLPVRLIIYDADGAECLRLDYTSFTYNPHFDENLFEIPA